MRGATPRGFPGRSVDCQRSGGGFALVLVLLLLTLLIVVVYSFVYSTRVNLRLARNRVADLQMTQLVKAGLEAMRARMASRCGPILGASQMMVRSTWSIRPPRAATRSRA